jgi:predicted phosphohydrolase
MKAIWLTDIHLEVPDAAAFNQFWATLCGMDSDAILISGDIANALTVENELAHMARTLDRPIYFVLGNHDYYRGSIADVRKAVADLCVREPNLHWLSICDGPIRLTATTSLIGHGGWGDGRLGDFHGSDIILTDFFLIAELTALSQSEQLQRLHSLGDEAAEHLCTILPHALESSDHTVVLTHVPPFREAAWYEGHHSDANGLPFFACKAVGDVLVENMQENPGKQMTVLCGHTHGEGTSQVLPNLTAHTGKAKYGHPIIQRVFEWA